MATVRCIVKDRGRLDRSILELATEHEALKEITRSQIKRLIEQGEVFVNGRPTTKAGAVVPAGATLEIHLKVSQPDHIEPFHFDLSVMFEDDALLVLDKPPGISMHPGAGERDKTLLNAIIGHLKVPHQQWPAGVRPGVVHRLDKDTSGVVVVAKTPSVHHALSHQFAQRTVTREYRALALCPPRGSRTIRKSDSGTIESALGRDPRNRTKIAVLSKGGRRALTEWRVLERMQYAALLAVRLKTGRTHQIRVHLDSIKAPLIGDRQYGDFAVLPRSLAARAEQFGRQALHASVLGFTHPETGARLTFESELPPDYLELINVFRAHQ